MFSTIPRRTKKGFTLIELLVVVAIIALLISILLPSLKRAKDQARQLKCSTNQRALFNAAILYAGDNKDYIPRGIMWCTGCRDVRGEYNVFASAILPYIGYNGNEQLWRGGPPHWVDVLKRLNDLVLQYEIFRCPSYPVWFNEENPDENLFPGGMNPMNYITSAFPMPYPEMYITEDAGNLEWDENGGWVPHGTDPSTDPYQGASRIESFPVEAQPSNMIFISEVDKTVPWGYEAQKYGLRFYTMFMTSHLPYGGRPRIGEDQRHPGGLNNFFFDGHGKTMDMHKMDPGYPNSIDKRLRYFTIMPDGWTP